MDYVLAMLLGLWLLASVLQQLPHSLRPTFLMRIDPAGLIPSWTFFAPRPGTTDFAVLYRDSCIDGALTSWRRLSSGTPRWAWIWHPDRRLEKLITDVVPGLASSLSGGTGSHLVSVPYLVLANAVCNAEHDCRASETQMAVMAMNDRHGAGEAGVVFVSDLIPLKGKGE